MRFGRGQILGMWIAFAHALLQEFGNMLMRSVKNRIHRREGKQIWLRWWNVCLCRCACVLVCIYVSVCVSLWVHVSTWRVKKLTTHTDTTVYRYRYSCEKWRELGIANVWCTAVYQQFAAHLGRHGKYQLAILSMIEFDLLLWARTAPVATVKPVQ